MGARWNGRIRARVLAVAVGVGVLGVPVVAPASTATAAPAAPRAGASTSETSSTFTGPHERISVSTGGDQANGKSGYPTVSSDGRYVTFTSDATNLVPGDSNGVNDLFLRDRGTNSTERINVASDGTQANGTMGPYIDSAAVMDAGARYVAFSSKATNLVPGDTNGVSDIFVRDRQLGTTTRVSTSASGAQGTSLSYLPQLSSDGRFLSFLTWSTLTAADTDPWADVYQKDLATGAIELISVGQDDGVRGLAQTADGSRVAYMSTTRLFIRDVAAATSVEVPLVAGGGTADDWIYPAGISPDGNRLVVSSDATNLAAGDTAGADTFVVDVPSGSVRRISAPNGGSVSTSGANLSADGSTVAFMVFGGGGLRIVDLDAGRTTVMPNDWASWNPSLAADGATVAFSSSSPSRVPGDTNGFEDVFLATIDASGDVAAPIVSCGGPDGNWHAANVTVACTSADLDSSLADPADASFTLATAVADGAETGSASTQVREVCDTVGNCQTVASSGHKVDRKAPVGSVPAEAQGSFVRGADVPAAFACTDGGSGVSSCAASIAGEPIVVGEALPTGAAVDATIDVSGTDAVGNTGGHEVPFEVVDEALTGLVVRQNGQGVGGATVSLWPDGAGERSSWATTGPDGSFAFDAADVGAGTFRVEVAKDGFVDAWYGGSDREGAEPVALGVRPADIEVGLTVEPADDVNPPQLVCIPPSPFQVRGDNVSVGCLASDDVALAAPGDGSFSLATTVADGQETHTAMTPSRPVCDTSDNCASAGPFGPYKVDRKAPTVTIGFPAEGQALTVGSAPYAAFDCTDLFLVTCSGPRGTPLDTTAGTHSFTVTATDAAGHTTTVTRSYVVPTTTITGRYIEYPTEKAISGATVELWAPWDPRSGPASASTTTSPNGAWTVANLIPDVPYLVRFTKTGYPTTWHGPASSAEASAPVSGPVGGVSTTYYDWAAPIDTTPPSATCTGPANPNAWSSSNVGFICQISDASGLAVGTPATLGLATTLSVGQESSAAPTASSTVCDVYGNCRLVGPFTARVDRKAPTVSCPPTNTAWSAAERTYSCTAADGGVGGQVPSFGLTTAVGAGNASASAATNLVNVCDALQNCTTAQITGNRVDRSPPTATCPVAPSTWSATNVSVSCTPADFGSGPVSTATVLASTSVPPFTETAGAAAVTPSICDVAGNCAVRQVLGFKIDRLGPAISCAPDGAWHNANVSLSCSHSDGGVGLPTQIDIFPPLGVFIPYSPNFSASTNASPGTESASVTATASSKCDLLNNCTPVSISGNKIDLKGPTTSSCPTPSASWSATDVTASCTAADGGSGLTTSSYSPQTNVGPGNESATALMGTVSVCDRVGNCSTLTAPGSWKVDRRAPVAACGGAPAAGAVLDHDVSVDCAVTDAGSGRDATTPAAFTLATSVGDGYEATASTTSRRLCDLVGNCRDIAARGPYGIDRKAPTVAVASPAGGAYFQLGSVPVADYECADLFLATCGGAVADGAPLPGTLGSHDVAVTATDQAGHTTTVTRSYTVLPVDAAAPTIRCATAPSPANWRGSEVSIACTATDASPLADPSQASFTVETRVGAGNESTAASIAPVEVCDVFGRCASTKSYGPYKIDRRAPDVPCTGATTEWLATNATVRCTPADAGSGTGAAFSLATAVPAGAWDANASTPSRKVCDVVGNCTTVRSDGFRIDRAGPVIACDAPPDAWSASNLTASCTATDPGAGYTGPDTISATTAVANGSETASASAAVSACDALGNCTKRTITGFKVDRRQPTVKCAAADGIWHADNVTLGCTQADGGSGLAPTSPEGGALMFDISTTVEDGQYNANASALAPSAVCDQVGNCRTPVVAGNKIDRRAPKAAVTLPKPGGTVVLGSTITVDFACSDAGAGVASCVGDLADGEPLTATTLGPKSFSVTVVDRAGNEATTTITYTVVSPVTGRIVDASGNGIEGVLVSRYAATGSTDPIDVVETAADGSFHFDDVTPGSYRFGAAKSDGYLPRFFANAATLAAAQSYPVTGTTQRVLPTLRLSARPG